MNSIVTVSFRYSASDFVSAWQTRFASRNRLKQNLTFALVIVVWALYMSYAHRSQFEWLLFSFSAAAVLLLILGSVAFRSVIPRVIFGISPKFREAYTITFSPEGVRVQTPRGDTKLDWSRYSRAMLDSEAYILCYGKNQFGVIPKRAFQTPEDQQAFEQMLMRFVPETTKRDV
jgi:diacylglycerol kinase